MQHVNDDMDLFRRAAEGYSLNTKSSNFNDVLKKLQAEKNIKPGEKPAVRNKKPWLLLLLLIPFAWICNNNFLREKQDTTAILHPANSIPPIKSDPAGVMKVPVRDIPVGSLLIPQAIEKHTMPSSFIQTQQRVSSIGIDPAQKMELLPYISNTAPTEKNNPTDLLPEKSSGDITSLISKNTDIPPIREADNKEEIETGITQTPVKKKKKLQQPGSSKGLYVGIIVSPDISTVKFQSVKNVGIGAGLLVGYQLNHRFSVESGVGWDKKFYYSDGEYANKDHVYLPSDAKLISLEGNCKMIEIPLNVKYNFKSKGNHNLSASGGVSSYIMKNETYDYLVERYNYQYKRTSSYKNSSKIFIAVVNVAAGYNLSLGKEITFRVEPYVKIPLKGAGITSIPIMSTGINIGITKKIF